MVHTGKEEDALPVTRPTVSRNTHNRSITERNKITETADDDCFCLPAAGVAVSAAGVSITEMIASHLIHSSYRVFHPA